MPRSHDTKPRKRDRHMGVSKRTPGASARTQKRRRLRQLYLTALAVEACERLVLAEAGKAWRWYERASRREAASVRQMAAVMAGAA